MKHKNLRKEKAMENTPSCKYFRSLADQYIEGELSAEQMRELEAHIAECEECRREFDELKALKDAIRSTCAELPEGLHERIMSAVKSEPKKKPARRHVFYRGAAISAACFMLCISFVVILSMMPFWNAGTGGGLPEDPMFASTEAVNTESNKTQSSEPEILGPNDVVTDLAESRAEEAPIDTVPETEVPEIPDTIPELGAPEITVLEETAPSVESIAVSSAAAAESLAPAPMETMAPETEALPESIAEEVEAETTKHYFKGQASGSSLSDKPSAEATYAPGGEEITMALLVVSGLLAVASFVAFLISLSSVRNTPHKKDKEE